MSISNMSQRGMFNFVMCIITKLNAGAKDKNKISAKCR